MAHLIFFLSPRLRTSYTLKTDITVGPSRDLTWKLWTSRRTSTLTKKDPVAQCPNISERKLLLKWEIESLQYNGTSTELHGYNELTLAEESSVKEGKPPAMMDASTELRMKTQSHTNWDATVPALWQNPIRRDACKHQHSSTHYPHNQHVHRRRWKPGRKLVGNIAYSCCLLFFSTYIISHCQIHLVQNVNVPVQKTVSTQPVGLLSPVF